MVESELERAFGAWLRALRVLTSDSDRLSAWQDRRFDFAYRVGKLLTEARPPVPEVRGHVLYGVSIPGVGLCYVGQTSEAERRLRDLTVGESHHLSTTAPTELWNRIVVVSWPSLLEPAPAEEREEAAKDMAACGLALEWRLHCHFHPPLNGRRRTSTGKWRDRHYEASTSIGAHNAEHFPRLFDGVLQAWSELENIPSGSADSDHPAIYRDYGRVVFPATLLDATRP
jgi:hypothetical protein